MTQEELKKVLQTIYKNIRCPSCGKKYDFGHIHIRGYFNNLCFLQLECSDHLPLFATIATPTSKVVASNQTEAINSDFVINAYEQLHQHNGNISELIND